MQRRKFLTGGAVLAAAAVLPTAAEPKKAEPKKKKNIELPPPEAARAEEAKKKLVLGQPCLQAPAATSMGVAWTVNVLANGWVDWSESPDLKDAKRTICGGFGVTGYDERVIQVRLTGLKPATRYYYRIGAQHIDYVTNYQRFPLDTATGEIHSFTTLGADGEGSFCVMNDTHAQWATFAAVTAKIAALKPAVTVWNGDASNASEKAATAEGIFLAPPIPKPGYSTEIPVLWNNGNHDFRGLYSRWLDRCVMTRLPDERASRDWALTRNWAVRQGDLALIGMDTGEDKPDCHPQFAGLVACEAYRTAQTAWLRDQFARPEIAKAPFKVVFCHIPLFDADPTSHPGDVTDDGDGKYTTAYAHWQKQCADAWGPLFVEHGVQLVVAAHCHRYRYDAADAARPWAQIVGGGCSLDKSAKNGPKFPTVIEGRVTDGTLTVKVHNVRDGVVAATHTFAPAAKKFIFF